MTQQELDSAVAIATGEDLCEIRRRGFSVADPFETDFDPEPEPAYSPHTVDWDQLQMERNVALFPDLRPTRRRAGCSF
ncbi:MAG: hypothetical protein KDA89_08960 [Planctomycetaceae bacterium]|nr:hypothetical protein [Planctomycetaceae bacterium]